MRDGAPGCVGDEPADKGAMAVSGVDTTNGGLYPDGEAVLGALPCVASIEAPVISRQAIFKKCIASKCCEK